MECAEIRLMLHADADGELDVANSLELARHLHLCPTCVAEKKSLQSLKMMLREPSLKFQAPDSLRKNVIEIPRKFGEEQRPVADLQWLWRWLAFGAMALAAVTILLRPGGVSDHDQLLNEAVAGHIRSLMAGHLTDVASSDQHTVKPWFDGKLDFAPNVKDFAAENFPLVGGRLDYLNGRPVAALVYRRDKHFINVFIWPVASNSAGRMTIENRRGYSIISAASNGFQYSIVSDVNSNTLTDFANLLRVQKNRDDSNF
jgi:anti-sigma factor RsiW